MHESVPKQPHRWTKEEARAAGIKGAQRDPERMREIGRRGGLATASKPGHMAEMGKRGRVNRRPAKAEQ